MFSLNFVLLGFLAIAQLSAALFKLPVVKIDDYLRQQLPASDDVAENLELASRWLRELELNGAKDKYLIEGLRTFVSLSDLNQCNKEAYDLMEKNAELVGSRALYFGNKAPRRIVIVMRKVGRRFAETCHRRHVAELAQIQATAETNLLHRAKNLYRLDEHVLDHSTDICAGRMSRNLLHKLLGAIKNVLPKNLQNGRKDHDLMLANKESNNESDTNKRRVGLMIDEFIIEPCRYLDSLAELKDLTRLVYLDSLLMRPQSSSWLADIKSPFESLVPASCLCVNFLRLGREAITREVVELVPDI